MPPSGGKEEKYKKMSVTAAKERKMGRRAPGTRRGRVAHVAVFAVVFALAAQDAHSQSKNTKKVVLVRFFFGAHTRRIAQFYLFLLHAWFFCTQATQSCLIYRCGQRMTVDRPFYVPVRRLGQCAKVFGGPTLQDARLWLERFPLLSSLPGPVCC